jgi:hypothetical protein
MSATEWASPLQQSDEFRGRLVRLFARLSEPNLFAWALTIICGQPVLIGTVARSYTFEHYPALGADHTAATDNVPYALMQAGEREAAIRLFLVLERSSALMIAAVAVAVPAMEPPASALFLFAIPTGNLMKPSGAARPISAAISSRKCMNADKVSLSGQPTTKGFEYGRHPCSFRSATFRCKGHSARPAHVCLDR